MTRLEMYEHNLSTNKQRVSKIAQRIVALSEGRDTPWDWNELLAEMETAISDTLRSRYALSVARAVLTTEVYVQAAQEIANE